VLNVRLAMLRDDALFLDTLSALPSE